MNGRCSGGGEGVRGSRSSSIVPLPGAKLRRAGAWGLGAGGVGGLSLDAVSFLVTREGGGLRILLSLALCIASAILVGMGFAVDWLGKRRYENGGAYR